MIRKLILCSFLFLSYAQLLFSQETFPINGVYDEQENYYAFTNATIYKSPTEKLDNATLLIKKGKLLLVV